eukprot:gb/GEZN01002665.1/.p1 GENE.gb/GEZN01002665.1/~~gb/GEZN01002665.1/.p1  ORF type:complete len:717 (+),score=9.01 gb/GEZN01002665.1/:157-2307(+)
MKRSDGLLLPLNRARTFGSALKTRPKLADIVAKKLPEITSNIDEFVDKNRWKFFDREEEKGKTLSEMIRSRVSPVYYIEASMGDDEITYSNSSAYGPLKCAISSTVLRIQISWHDVMHNPDIGNYSESYVLSPLTCNSGFDTVKASMGFGAVPFVLDESKLKQNSAVRKSSDMETDLESKFKYLSVKAEWTTKSWLSYDHAQLALTYAMTIFDFRSSREFCFMYNSEGGSGGKPPWDVTQTCYNALYFYDRGKSKLGVVGCLSECVDIRDSIIPVNDSIFLRAVHLSMHNISAWKKYISAFEKAKISGLSEEDIAELSLEDSDIPEVLIEDSIPISINDVMVGGIISTLRSEKLIMTELDVRLKQESLKKNQGLMGNIPMWKVYEDSEKESELLKRKRFYILSGLFSGSVSESLRRRIDSLPKSKDDICETFRKYYKRREYIDISSFSYNSYVRIFKTSDVLGYYDNGGNKELVESMFNEQSYIYSEPIKQRSFIHSQNERESIADWFRNLNLGDLFKGEIPDLGVADPIILKRVQNAVQEDKKNEYGFLIVSKDYGLLGMIRKYGSRFSVGISPEDYLMLELSRTHPNMVNQKICDWAKRGSKTLLPGIYSAEKWTAPQKMVSDLRMSLKRPLLKVIFDKPNVRRRLNILTRKKRILYQDKSGFLTKLELKNDWDGGNPVGTKCLNDIIGDMPRYKKRMPAGFLSESVNYLISIG